ncbi:FAD:protein FMN transferase [Croceiramulus getboli]|nr:FAD:protein FMN transferase [Flavobacteriaceae bacterium YJPT1-3]
MRIYHYIVIFLLCLSSCQEPQVSYQVVQGEAFGTTYGIQLYSTQEQDWKTGIDSVVQRVNQSMSTYLPTSDISRINQGDTSVVVDIMFQEVFSLSRKLHQQTDGFFDPTVGVLANAYGFGPGYELNELDQEKVDSLLEYVGFQKVQLTESGRIQKNHPAIAFDFSAIAKGYGIDRIGAYLEAQGVQDYLIELGGELLARGRNLRKEADWRVGIENVDSQLAERSYSAAVRLRDQGMATSGNYRKYRIDPTTGARYVHTLDPRTGSAQASNVLSASVLASTCAAADGYATAFMAMGLEKAQAFLKAHKEIDAYLIYEVSKDSTSIYATPGFRLQLD